MSPHGSGLTPAQLWARFQQYPYHLARAVLVVAAVLGVYAIIHSIESVLFPVTASLLLAYVADPLVDRIEARGYQRTTAIMVLLCTIGLGATGLVLFLYPTIAQLLGSIVERLHAEKPKGTLVIQADKESKNDVLVQVMDASRRAGLYDIALAAHGP